MVSLRIRRPNNLHIVSLSATRTRSFETSRSWFGGTRSSRASNPSFIRLDRCTASGQVRESEGGSASIHEHRSVRGKRDPAGQAERLRVASRVRHPPPRCSACGGGAWHAVRANRRQGDGDRTIQHRRGKVARRRRTPPTASYRRLSAPLTSPNTAMSRASATRARQVGLISRHPSVPTAGSSRQR